MKKKCVIAVAIACSILAGCQKEPVANETVKYVTMDKKVDTTSAVKTSYTATVKEYDMVVYLGHPVTLSGDAQWVSEDTSVLTVSNSNKATAWQEGTVTISNGTESMIVLCTTINDDKAFDYCQYTDEEIMEWCWHDNNPKYIAENINTVKDLQKFIVGAGYEYKELCINVSHNWSWAASPEGVVESRGGICQDLASFAVYILQNDYEDVGVIAVSGQGVGYAYNYVYENGQYLIFDISQLLCGWGFEETDWYVVEDLKDFKDMALNKSPQEYTLCILAISANNNEDISSTYTSYMQDDSQALAGDAVIGLERGTKYTVIFSSELYKYTIEEMDVYPGVKSFR